MSDSVRSHRRQPTRVPIPGILQARTLEELKIKKNFFNLKNDNSKNISRTFSGVVVASVGSVHFQIVP